MNHIVVGFDGSTNAHRALEEALDIASAETRITVVAAAQAPAPRGEVLPAGAEGLEERERELEDARRHPAERERDAEVVERPSTCWSRKRRAEGQTSSSWAAGASPAPSGW